MLKTENGQPAERPDALTADNNPVVGPAADAPLLTARGLTIMLVIMCVVPIVIITVLQFTMPPVRPGFLKADISVRNAPPRSYYRLPPEQRREFPEAELLVTNLMDVPWTHLNIRINHGNYQVYDHVTPLGPGETRAFRLDRFVHRSGAEFQVGVVPPQNVEIYAGLPDRSRATLEYELPDYVDED